MKKIFIILAVIFIAADLNAQWFLGGEIGLSVSNENENTVMVGMDRIIHKTEVGFVIAPKGGYYFNEKLALGLSFHVGPSFVIDESDKDTKYREYSVNWSVYPFVRYSVFTYKRFSLILEGYTGIGGAHFFWKLGDDKTEKGLRTLAIGVVNVTPILSFNLTERLQFEAGLHFLNIGYNIDIAKGEVGIYNTDYIKHDLNIGFNSSSILVMTQLRVGVIYKF